MHKSSLINKSRVLIPLILLVCLGLSLRLVLLGNTFQSSDNVELATRVILLPGYAWMIREYYGVLINLLVKVSVGVVSLLGIAVTEFWWKAPVALLGALQVPLTYRFVKRLGGGWMAALVGAAFVSVLPIHVMQSRYLATKCLECSASHWPSGHCSTFMAGLRGDEGLSLRHAWASI